MKVLVDTRKAWYRPFVLLCRALLLYRFNVVRTYQARVGTDYNNFVFIEVL